MQLRQLVTEQQGLHRGRILRAVFKRLFFFFWQPFDPGVLLSQ